METYGKIQTLFKRDMDGSRTGQKGKMIEGEWSTPELGYLANNEWQFTEKVDGTNIRIELNSSVDFMSAKYGGRTDRAIIPKPLFGHLEETFPTFPNWRADLSNPPYRERYKFVHQWMVDSGLDNITLYGEGYGPKIEGGGKYRDDHSFVLFDVKIGDFWLDRANVDDVAQKLGIDSVPVIGQGTLWDAINIVKGDRDNVRVLDKHLVFGGRMNSFWGEFEAEGIVARPVIPLFNRKGERIITKVKSVDFK